MNVNSYAISPPAAGIICLVDDDLSMLRALDRLLSSVGLQAQLFSEPLAFLSYVICNSVALAVIDIWMSDMSGLEVQKELQVVSPKTRVIINTANHDDPVTRQYRAALSPISLNLLTTTPFSPPCIKPWPSECFDARLAGSVG